VAAPFREAEFDIIYGEGISREGDLIDLGVTSGVVEKSGTWISYKGERLGQGRENARVFLRENTGIRGKLETEMRKALGLVAVPSNGHVKEAAKPEASDDDKPLAHAATAGAKSKTAK
jgi:recombination protein RecA